MSEISGDRALLGRDGGICSWVYLKDLTLVSGGVAKPIEVGCQVTINKGAVYGGLTSARGRAVPSAQLAPKQHTVSKIQTNKGVREALLKEITSWEMCIRDSVNRTKSTRTDVVNKGIRLVKKELDKK